MATIYDFKALSNRGKELNLADFMFEHLADSP